ncbi:hypothetical protein B0T26DRAFT_189169 [Lasiosphaeria miniovina]|uniref:Secreted protein n=1 Tax=Lasiosphaeria miniovina TaxID=1954250 RepID=A0AA40E2A8_9PEZI|nr:uncharacterized protein B0T26DRAFT_189169 [Lasiosphaeria miniovina]KAK0721626.1 hypothetical protein B0T26DRAFT_189169 [Lasiosphaeria miniovina]
MIIIIMVILILVCELCHRQATRRRRTWMRCLALTLTGENPRQAAPGELLYQGSVGARQLERKVVELVSCPTDIPFGTRACFNDTNSD